MEQKNEALAPASQDQVNSLTEMVQKLLREKEINQEPEDPYVTRRIPVTDLSSYPELIEALQPIEEGFYRSPVTEDERKIESALVPGLDNSGLDTSEDTEIMFASTIRALLSDLAATVAQVRLENLHKGPNLPGKPTQLT
ncbi:hypothetical protein AYI70_g5460 [Smittium culicis]|uniref:Uncharacterized protein n=1 Tax=Smittium culicis TaxID=133412 RepID=A0A1R1XUG6_9FUNG|nr:hypothetical protein AYI70_g5460 [Smittium culicis]